MKLGCEAGRWRNLEEEARIGRALEVSRWSVNLSFSHTGIRTSLTRQNVLPGFFNAAMHRSVPH